MKILKSSNKIFFLISFILLFGFTSFADEKPVDIWNIDTTETKESSTSSIELKDEEIIKPTDLKIFDLQSKKKESSINLDENLEVKKISIFGLYDPEDFGLDINMWLNSDGDQLKNIFNKLKKINFSKDATEIMKVSMLTNAYLPKKNISEKDFLKYRSDWLIKNSDLDLIENYLVKNQIFDVHPELTKYLIDRYLSEGNVDKSCEVFSKNLKPLKNEYLFKFNIYCLIKSNRKDEALIIFDLKKELGFNDKYFEKKINNLLGYDEKINEEISEKNILDFHLAVETNPDFKYEPNNNTNKIIWKYLSSSNLLDAFEKIEISELEKISTLEKAAHNKNYPEKDLFEIYKRFQFNFNLLLNAEKKHNTLSNIEARALIYQKILLESEIIERLKLLKILKSSFENDGLSEAFDVELKKFLNDIEPREVPDNLTSFYYTNIKIKSEKKNKLKFNNDILHQSKLVNYFNGDYSKSKIEKDLESFLKKIKKNKKYFFSKKDQIFLESLRFDGINISEKYKDLYQEDASEIPTDIQVMINNNEKGAALLRLAEIIGQDDLNRIDEDTIYFIISTLNQLNIDQLRNKILLKVLPLKV